MTSIHWFGFVLLWNAHFHLSRNLLRELWATIWEDLQIWESFVGHKVHKILLLRLSRVRKYWLRLGAFDKFSIFGHLCSFCVCVLPASAPELSDGISFLHFSNLRTSLRDHLATPAHFLPQFSYQWVPAIIQICLCSPSLASLALAFDNSSWEEIVQMSDLASYVTHPGQWFGKTRVSVTGRARYCHYYTSLRSFYIYQIVYLQFWNTSQTPLLPLF